MKKHDEGYTLPFVLVILTILYFVVSIVLTSAETTVTAQQQSIAQMKQKYAAQGKIEMLVGQLCDDEAFTSLNEVNELLLTGKVLAACEAINDRDGVDQQIIRLKTDDGGMPECEYTFDNTSRKMTYTFKMISEYHSIQIETQMILTGTVSETVEGEEPNTPVTYNITDLSVAYDSYQIGGDAA